MPELVIQQLLNVFRPETSKGTVTVKNIILMTMFSISFIYQVHLQRANYSYFAHTKVCLIIVSTVLLTRLQDYSYNYSQSYLMQTDAKIYTETL